jgi:hypothetical protein
MIKFESKNFRRYSQIVKKSDQTFKNNLFDSNRIFSIKYGLSKSMFLMWLFSFLLLCGVAVPVLLLAKIE